MSNLFNQAYLDGQRQYVWTYPVLDPSEVKQEVKYRSSRGQVQVEVKQAETVAIQGLS
ncbi:MAG: hypothetical protein QNJ65_17870 [Xenococcaceae cyanobacterium MO_234.B1]|nr:hypothetical protein [Xenococcaceae cyanobacterium MO_234.B1]